MTDQIEELREKLLAAPSRSASSWPPSFGPIVLGEMTRAGETERSWRILRDDEPDRPPGA
jgi:hypothetical protein